MMSNFKEYLLTLESLYYPIVGAPNDGALNQEQRLKSNLKILENNIKLDPNDIIKNIIKDKDLQHLQSIQHKINENADDYFRYCLYSVKMLLEICKNANFTSSSKEDLVSEKHKSLIISSMVDVASFGLKGNLQPSFYKEKGSIFKKECKLDTNIFRLQFMVEIFSSIIYIRALHIGNSLNDVQLWYMASIFSLLIAFDEKDIQLEQSDIGHLQVKLQKLWLELPKKLYYRNLMLLYSSLAHTHRQRIHREMLLRLWYPGGFVALLFAMTDSTRSEEQSLDEIVSNIVAQPNFSTKAQQSLIKQILEFLEASLKNKDYAIFMGAGLLSLRKLYNNKAENKQCVINWLEKKMKPIMKPDINELIAMEWSNFIDLISLLFHIFCTSTIATLPSELLVPYLPLILELYSQLECYKNQNIVCCHLNSLILQILNNRSTKELKEIIEYVSTKSYPKESFQLSPNVRIKENPLNVQTLKLSLVDNEVLPLMTDNKHPLASLVAILKNSSHNLLVYQLFLMLLQLVPSVIVNINSSTISKTNIDLLQTEEDIYNKVLMDFSQLYENKLQIIKALESLVQHLPLKALINDNIKDLLKVLQDILIAFAATRCEGEGSCQTDINSTVLTILLILIREIIEDSSVQIEDLQKNLFNPLSQLKSQIQNQNLNYQINCLLNVIKANKSPSSQHYDFKEARALIESNESYLQVQGIEMMIRLLKKRDDFVVANGSLLTALALNTLKSTESYTFLNCVRLFVALVNVNESEVLNLLSDEYLNEAAAMDYRLVVGEAILKTSKELGPFCYKYKNVLLNTFMAGCRSPLDEFRFSAFSNLSQMCRQLTYQVHNYFQELLNLINGELTSEKYLPAQRAAVMILSDLLAGMDNLFDYEEMLLPIYRQLKHLVASEKNDAKIRAHASNGLKTLAEKCKEFFRTGLEQHQQNTPLEKEIKIVGINDRNKSLKKHILEIN